MSTARHDAQTAVPADPGRRRVLFVTSSFPRWEGDSTTPFVLHLAQDLSDIGWRVSVLAPHAPGAATRGVLGGIPVSRFRYLWPERLETVCYDGGALQKLQRNRSNLLKLPLLVAAEWLAVARRLVARRFDLVHSHWMLPQGLVTGLLARPLGVPHVLTVHGGDAFALRGRLLRSAKSVALGLADAVTVNSSATETAVAAIRPGLGPVRRIPMGATVPAGTDGELAGQLRERYRRDPGPLLVFVGRMVPEKGLDDLLRAVGLLVKEAPAVTCLALGDGPQRAALESLARQLGIAERVHFTGWVQPGELGAYLKAADIFVGPSKTGVDGWREAQGLTFIEAMLAEIPVVATASGGIVDAVRDGETGILVPEAAPAAVAEAVKRIWSDPELRMRLSSAAQELAMGQFTRRASAACFAAVYESLLGPA